MKRSLKELNGYTVQAIDGEKGKVKDFLFDDETWIVRYLEADLGTFFKDKRVLIPRENLGEPKWDDEHFPVELTVKRIEESPELDFDRPVSRKYEQELMGHYELDPYWPATVAAFSGRESMFTPDSPFKTPVNVVDEEKLDTNLRSFKEVKGYYINATDERFGHISDLIIDTIDWQIVYAVVDTKNILPWSKKVILPIELIDKISFPQKEAVINLSKETIKNAPEYNSALPINEEYESVMRDFYGNKIVH